MCYDIRRFDGIEILTTATDIDSTYLHQLEFFINTMCKIPFQFSVSKETKQFIWGDLIGPEKHLFQKNALEELFPKLPNVQHVQKLWDSFLKLYAVLQQEEISNNEIDTFRKDAKQWVLNFTMIYQSKNVTPYIHILAQHIPEFIQKYSNISQFAQQGLEKLNNQTTIDFVKSMNHDYCSLAALTQLLQKRNRVEYVESNGFQCTSNKVICSVCKGKGHNSCTCKKKHL